MSDNVEVPVKKKRGRPANPLTPLIRDWEKANAKAAKARAAYERVAELAEDLADAEEWASTAHEALQDGLKAAGLPVA